MNYKHVFGSASDAIQVDLAPRFARTGLYVDRHGRRLPRDDAADSITELHNPYSNDGLQILSMCYLSFAAMTCEILQRITWLL